jgi:CDP-glucose 4,6-dehydratase
MESWSCAMESLVIKGDFWNGRRVFLTGHTGFKGAWTSLLLRSLGAEVFGFALGPKNDDLFVTAGVGNDVHHAIGDVRDLSTLHNKIVAAQPEIVIHMAAQALVQLSYADPVETYQTNIIGTVNLLEAARRVSSVKAVLIITSDKCYENRGWVWGYREADSLGGHDPYSNSKACAELVTDSYRRSFFGSPESAVIASGRAGNVIGGGDWARGRLIPDAMRAFLQGDQVLRVRNPGYVRPWQHVLDPVIAYLLLAERMIADGHEFAEAWNFGPSAASEVAVEEIADRLVRLWGGSSRWIRDEEHHPPEAAYLKLDCSKARTRLQWAPLLDLENALELTVQWYRAFGAGMDMRSATLLQIEKVVEEHNTLRNAA